jgi:AraC-like DNA-binding protein
MEVVLIRSMQGPDKSFIFCKDNNSFAPWHNHPEYELILVLKGRGKRMVGDNIGRFCEHDLVFLGPYTPHEYLCDSEFYDNTAGFQGACIFIQFQYDFLGEKFFEVPENLDLKKFIKGSSRGYEFFGETKKKVISRILKMADMNDKERLYALFSIFRLFATTKEFKTLSSPAFDNTFWLNKNESMQKALQFISQNFHRPIGIQDLLKVTNMSNSSFYDSFKTTYRMPFKDYLLNLRVGYACKLLTHSRKYISGAAYNSGFGNISNFNRQFKKIKGITPSQFLKQVNNMEGKE